MGKYLTNFKTKEEYNSFKDSSNYIYPNISYIEDSGSVINKSPQIQEKQVEITENGEITITPDAGFAYLNKVSVKTNVEGQGGGSASGNEVFNCEYLDISEVSNKLEWVSIAILAKTSSQGMTFIAPSSYNPFGLTGLLAVAVDFNFSIVAESGGQKMEIPIRELLNQNGVSNEDIAAIPRITKEEFYTL